MTDQSPGLAKPHGIDTAIMRGDVYNGLEKWLRALRDAMPHGIGSPVSQAWHTIDALLDEMREDAATGFLPWEAPAFKIVMMDESGLRYDLPQRIDEAIRDGRLTILESYNAGPGPDEVIVKREEIQIALDLMVRLDEQGSGSMEDTDVETLRRFAVILGIDPITVTPEQFANRYYHEWVHHTWEIKANNYGSPRLVTQWDQDGRCKYCKNRKEEAECHTEGFVYVKVADDTV